MSLNKIHLTTVIKNQFYYKLSINAGVFTSLVILQVLGLLLSMGGSSVGGYSSDAIEISYIYYSINGVITFTLLWGFIHSIIMATKTNWEQSLIFVGNRFSHDVSNMIFLLVMSFIGGILTVLTNFLFQVMTYYFLTDQTLTVNTYALTGQELFSGLTSMFFYLLLFSALGYFIGTVTRLHRMMSILLPATTIGMTIGIVQTKSNVLMKMIEFYFQEKNFSVFIAKIIVSVLVLFFASILISSRTEVRR